MLAIVTVSYRQTIKAYPKGASSYIVASDNLGSTHGRAGGGGAAHRLHGDGRGVGLGRRRGDDLARARRSTTSACCISVALVLLLMLGNLRGIRESGTIFMIPTYAYIVVMLAHHRLRRRPA